MGIYKDKSALQLLNPCLPSVEGRQRVYMHLHIHEAVNSCEYMYTCGFRYQNTSQSLQFLPIKQNSRVTLNLQARKWGLRLHGQRGNQH